MLTAQQIVDEIAQLDELIERPRDLNHAATIAELHQAQRRRQMLQAALRNLVEPLKGEDNGN